MSEKADIPITGDKRDMLGIRPGIDIRPDDEGKVWPQAKGMSVNICPCQVPILIMPARLQYLKRGAIGNDNNKVWSMGTGPFEHSAVAPKLELLPDAKSQPASHGVVQPDRVMLLEEYQAALADTQEDWAVDEQRNHDCPFCR